MNKKTSTEHHGKSTRREPAQQDIIPTASYRLQFNRGFTFRDATGVIPYLDRLGITHCYTSPYLMARPGSNHGYDIIDHDRLNPEIGTDHDFEFFSKTLCRHGMQQILDIVPNHMAVMGNENSWWLDVLENGPAADHAEYFDIDWKPVKKELHGKVLLPLLGDHYGKVLFNGELRLIFDSATGAFNVWYANHQFPIDPQAYPHILGFRIADPGMKAGTGSHELSELEDLITCFNQLPGHSALSDQQRKVRRRNKELYKKRLAKLCTISPPVNAFINRNIEVYNGQQGSKENYSRLHALLELQAYRLAFWKTASDEINYRRFFDINGLAGMRMEKDKVFDATHRLIFRLIEEKKIAGIRIDHLDGLYNPERYLEKLNKRTTGEHSIYIIAEKILANHERLRDDWPVHGTTGYDFANLVNGLFIDPDGERVLNITYHRFVGRILDYDEVLYSAKRRIINVEMAGELNVLANQLNRISEYNPETRDFTLNSLRYALIEVIACFPVYRTYITGPPVLPEDRKYIEWAVVQAKKRSVTIETSVFDFLQYVLTLDIINNATDDYRGSIVDFVMHFQQYTSPVLAKGMEDTALYRYNRLISLNEVGGDPKRFGVSVNAFHYLNRERLKYRPHTMLSTSTHDSKRSEDVRARINVLSEVPDKFQRHLHHWRRLNRRHKIYINKRRAPGRNDEYLLYQTLAGSWPLQEPDNDTLKDYQHRITQYMLKAVREAKEQTSWSHTNPEYEQALTDFIETILGSLTNNAFLDDFVPFANYISRYGLYNSLAQCLLKFTTPGMPDIYQGNELFEFNLTDPDNRRPVDYSLRTNLLAELSIWQDLPVKVSALMDNMSDAKCKFYLTWKVLNLRRQHKQVFQSGDYVPLNVQGKRSDHVCAFARTFEQTAFLTVVPRLTCRLCKDHDGHPLGPIWSDTWLELPETIMVDELHNDFTGEQLRVLRIDDRPGIYLSSILKDFPVALLTNIPCEKVETAAPQ